MYPHKSNFNVVCPIICLKKLELYLFPTHFQIFRVFCPKVHTFLRRKKYSTKTKDFILIQELSTNNLLQHILLLVPGLNFL
jgi:hypothetical protein